MARPPAVDGGRPNQVTVRFSNREIAEIDDQLEGLKRSDYIRTATLATARRAVDLRFTPPQDNPGGGDHMSPHQIEEWAAKATAGTPGTDTHDHQWKQFSKLLDHCDYCGADRPHEAGTR